MALTIGYWDIRGLGHHSEPSLLHLPGEEARPVRWQQACGGRDRRLQDAGGEAQNAHRSVLFLAVISPARFRTGTGDQSRLSPVCSTIKIRRLTGLFGADAVSTGSFAKLEAVLASSGGPFLMGEHVSGLMLAEAPMYIQMCDEG
eukprot:545822-Prorocentrum_minimum.AAC.1